jgi:hypothetical protein
MTKAAMEIAGQRGIALPVNPPWPGSLDTKFTNPNPGPDNPHTARLT